MASKRYLALFKKALPYISLNKTVEFDIYLKPIMIAYKYFVFILPDKSLYSGKL